MASNVGLFDCLPSIRRPMAWETSGRGRHVAGGGSPLSDADGRHSADESFVRRPIASGWRTSVSLPGSATRRPVVEVQSA